MRITILNGNPSAEQISFDNYLVRLVSILSGSGHIIQSLTLRNMNIQYCTGCFACWVKTPGKCQYQDDSHMVCHAMINSDFILWASPLIMGYPSAILKKAMDKSIPLIHPYFEVVHGEAHHRKRYDSYPMLGLLVASENTSDLEDLNLIQALFSRTALNFKSRLAFFGTIDAPQEDTAQAIIQSSESTLPLPDYPAPTSGTVISSPRKLTIFNGSPRGRKSNSATLLEQFASGFSSIAGNSVEIFHLVQQRDVGLLKDAFLNAECVCLGFPLYADAMPGVVKSFIEALEPFVGRSKNPPMGFLVQSGFPESAHSRFVEAYVQKLAWRLGSPYLGTIVKGGCEGVRMMPENMNRKLFLGLRVLGRGLALNGLLDHANLVQLSKPERYPAILTPVIKLLSRTPLLSFYWDKQLKDNAAYEKRFDKPYIYCDDKDMTDLQHLNFLKEE